MITQDIIEEVKNRLVEAYKPVEIYIFGSYAWGTPDEDSDLDILIVVEQLQETQQKACAFGYELLFDVNVPKDIVVYPKAEFEKKSEHVSSIFHRIKKQGKKIYARA